jgi:hypothetical protein
MPHGGCREHLTKEKDDQPAGAFANQPHKGDGCIRFVEGLGTTDLLDLPGPFRFRQPKDIVQCYDTQQYAVVVGYREGIPLWLRKMLIAFFSESLTFSARN